ncbi:MAG: type II secretion system F family protein [Planctomycetes bacterium]|nr:type II secretion system F family protein [Planctomycetota bacterium]
MLVEYEAINHSGVIVKDRLTVEDMSAAKAEIARRGLTAVRVHQAHSRGLGNKGKLGSFLKQGSNPSKPNPKKASKRELSFFTTQMSIMLETGTPVASSLSALEKQMSCPHWKYVVGELFRHVAEGGSLATAVGLFPRLFDSLYSSMISAGESSGKLPEILTRLADITRQADRLKGKIKSAMIYPILLVVVSTMVLAVLTFFVLPRFGDIFTEMKVDLPASTKGMLAVSELIRENFLLALLGGGAALFGLVYWLMSDPGRKFVARYSLKLPIAGELISSLINARIFRLLGLLIESNVPLLDSLKLVRASIGHYMYSDMVQAVHDEVLVGRPMYESMQKSGLVPPSIVQMVQTGEDSGRVGRVMTMLADYLDDRNETQISTLTSIMEPVILIFMGLFIGTIAVSLVLPMFDLSTISG